MRDETLLRVALMLICYCQNARLTDGTVDKSSLFKEIRHFKETLRFSQ